MNNYDLSGYDYDLYLLLGVNKNATQDEIKKAYRNLSIKYHPDVNKDTGTEGRFKTINYAYQVLSCPEKREHYNKYLESGEKETPRGKESQRSNESGEKETPADKESQGNNDESKSQQGCGCGCITLLVLLVASFFLISRIIHTYSLDTIVEQLPERETLHQDPINPDLDTIGTNCDHNEEVFTNAIHENDVKKVEFLLNRCDLLDKIGNDTNNTVEEILLYSIEIGSNEVVKLLLDNGVDPNHTFFNNRGEKLSILTHAVYEYENNKEVVILLLDKGADPNYVIFKSDGSEDSVLDVVLDASLSSNSYYDVAKLLLDYGAESKIGLDKFLLRAIDRSNKELILLLINNEVDLNQKTEFGTIFARAVLSLRDEDLIKLLLDKGADPNINMSHTDKVSLVYALIAYSVNYDYGGRIRKLVVDNGGCLYKEEKDKIIRGEVRGYPSRKVESDGIIQDICTIQP